MDVKPGYKMTEVGVIPEDWEVEQLGKVVCRFKLGGNYPNQEIASSYPLMKMGNMTRGSFDISKTEFVSHGIVPEEQHRLTKGDVLFNTRNTMELVGKVAMWRDELPHAFYNSNLMRLEFDERKIGSNEYVNFAFNTAGTVARLRALATGTTSVAAIYTRDLMGLLLIIPPLPEQRAIAAALSDVDALIESLEKLIAKKRDVKQATMQQLLTGTTRLPGFEGEWEVKRLGEIGSAYGGLTGKTKADFGVGSARYITFMNVMANVMIDGDMIDLVRVSATESQNKVNKGDLLFNGSSETPEEIAMCSWMANDIPNLYLNSFCFGFRLHDERLVDGLFLSYYLRSIPGRELMKTLAQGSTRYNLSKSALLEAQLTMPDKVEQTAIAAVLSDMDSEIKTLEARRDKTKLLKQGMMQELLTGKTRLV